MSLYLVSDSLENVFSSSNGAMLLLDGYIAAIMINDSEYFFFDSHECDESGIPVVSKDWSSCAYQFFKFTSAWHTHLYLGKQLGHPTAHVDARHSSKLSRKLSSDEFSGLEPTIFLAKDATVILTMNLWSTVELCNGAGGKIGDLIYDNDQCPPNLPIAVIVQFDDYSGPSFIESAPNCFPVCPGTAQTFS